MKCLKFILIILSLSACQTPPQSEQLLKMDRSDKSITVPTSQDFETITAIKSFLRKEGFKIIIDQGGVEQKKNKNGYLFNNERKTRYTLIGNSSSTNSVPLCMRGKIYNYTMIDNKTGQEVFSIGGKTCGKENVLKEFKKVFIYKS
jgi:hypothetical protein